MKIPYGNADFGSIRREGYFYVDKTRFLAELESDEFGYRNLVFLRPRRMGKSSLINMMAHYYDMTKADEFDRLFEGLWVQKHPTPGKNGYVVLHLNFGRVSGNDEAAVRDGFAQCIRRCFRSMLPRLIDRSAPLREFYESLPHSSDPLALMDNLIGIVAGMGLPLYIMIDEYDTFANSLISTGGKDLYESLTAKTGFVRSFYRTLKAGVDTGGISRIFITGVAPLLLDDLYTGFNIATNISTTPRFNALAGFTRLDVEHALDELLASRPDLATLPDIGDRASLLDVLEQHYNGYRFSNDANERVFNSDMVLYFLRSLVERGKYPEQMLDTNARTDYKKFYGLFHATGQPAEDRRKVLETVMTEGAIWGKLLETFGQTPSPPPREQFISLLYYTGMLTLSAEPRVGWMNRFEIPNLVIRELQWEHFGSMLKDASSIELIIPEVIEGQLDMAKNGSIESFATAIHEQVMQVLGVKDLMKFNEKAIKMILITSAVLSSIFHVLSEKEFAQGFCDLFMSPKQGVPNAKYSWLIELKYLPTDTTEKNIADAFEQAQTQIERYAADKVLVPLLTRRHELKAVAIVFVGTKQIRCRPWPKGSGDEIRVGEWKTPTMKAPKKVAQIAAKKAAKKAPAKKKRAP